MNTPGYMQAEIFALRTAHDNACLEIIKLEKRLKELEATRSKKYPVICLCGSTKFKDQFITAQRELTLGGWIVLSVGLFNHADSEDISESTKKMLDDMHKAKIDMAHSIFVINPGGYTGSSTKNEIAYAMQTGKVIKFLEEKPVGYCADIPEDQGD